jgi:hypothetical protein
MSRDPGAGAAAAALAARLLAAIHSLAALVLPVLAAPEESNVGAEDVDADDVATWADDDAGAPGAAVAAAPPSALGPSPQVVACACWMSMKEAALTLGTLCRVAPLGALPAAAPAPPAAAPAAASSSKNPEIESEAAPRPPPAAAAAQVPLLDAGQLRAGGELLLSSLLVMKHNGAVDKTQQGFAAVAGRLLCDPGAAGAAAALPARWLAAALAHLRRPGQGAGDIVRRSAGLPCAVQAVCAGEPRGGARPLAERALRELLRTAGEEGGAGGGEPWPRVHAFNALRMLYLDTELAATAGAHYAAGERRKLTQDPTVCSSCCCFSRLVSGARCPLLPAFAFLRDMRSSCLRANPACARPAEGAFACGLCAAQALRRRCWRWRRRGGRCATRRRCATPPSCCACWALPTWTPG